MSVRNSYLFVAFACTALLLGGCAQNYRVDVAAIENAEILNYSHPEGLVFASGQPTQEQLPVIAGAGVRHVISLRTEGEIDWNEAEAVEASGMQFHSIPVSGRDGLTSANAQALEDLLSRLDGQPVLLHCGTSNRVGGLKALTASDHGASIEEAVVEGRRWGLSGLEEGVREVLSAN